MATKIPTPKQKQKVLERAFWKCNSIEHVNIYDVIYDYRTIYHHTNDAEVDAIHDYISERLGYGTDLMTDEKWDLLIENGWIEKPEIDPGIIGTKSYVRNEWWR